MTVARIEEVTLYTSSTEDAVGTHELRAWFDHSGIDHIKLNYADVDQIPAVLSAINTWWQADEQGVAQDPVTSLPIVIYTEVHSGKPVSYLPRKYIAGKDTIIAQLPTLYALGR